MQKKILIYSIFLFSLNLFSQTGPGGVGNSSTNVLWVRSEDIDLNDGDLIENWYDISSNNNHLSQETDSYKPHFKIDIVNSYPVVRFDQNNNRIRKTNFNNFPSAQITAIYVNKTESENEGILSYATSTDDNTFLLYGSNKLVPHIYSQKPDPQPAITANDNVWHIINTAWRDDTNEVVIWKDGSVAFSDSIDYDGSLEDDGCFAVAGEQDGVDEDYSDNQDHQGDFTEIMLFNTYLSNVEHIIINNYLAAKYSISLSEYDYYTQDDSGNGDFDFNVAGIGQAADGSSHTDSQGTGIIRINNPSALADDTYLFWGENNKEKIYYFDETIDQTKRLTHTWRISKYNDLGSVSVQLQTSRLDETPPGNTIQLIISSNADFSDKTIYNMNLSGDYYTVDNINFNDGDYFSFEFPYEIGYSGPGGVGNDDTQALWVRSEDINLNDGDLVATWNDHTAHANHLTQDEDDYKPHFKIDIVNSYPVIRFDQEHNRIRKTDFTGFPSGKITAIYVNNTQDSNDGILSYATSTNDNTFLIYGSGNLAPHIYDTKPDPLPDTSVNDGNWHIVNTAWKDSTDDIVVWKDGNNDFSNTVAHQGGLESSGCFAVGDDQDGVDSGYDDNQWHTGDFTEIILYNEYLNKAQHIIVSNYLAAKYDIAMASNDYYTQDDSANGDFDFNVAGIGQADNGFKHTDAQGTGIIRINNASDLDNDSYLFWGENVKNATYEFEYIDDDTYRINTLWRVNKRNTVGTVRVSISETDIDFDPSILPCAGFKLVVSDQADLSSATTYPLNLTNGIYTAENVSFNDNDYFSLEYSVDKTVWDGNNWSNNIPDLNKKAVFSEDYDMENQNSISACSCQVASGKTLHITNGKYLEVSNNIINDGNIIIETEGSLVQTDDNSSISGEGIFQLNKTSMPLDNYYDYVFWASPIISGHLTLGDIKSDSWRYYKFDPAIIDNDGQIYPGWVMLTAGDIVETGTGYAISADTDHTAGNPLYASFVKENDPFNNGLITVNVYKKDGEGGDNNLLGNPYPSAIDFDQFANDNTAINGSYALWTKCADLDQDGHHQESGYTVYTVSEDGGTAVAACDSDGETAGRYIASTQGFMVIANTDNASVSFSNTYRVTGNNDNFLNRPASNKDIIWLNMTNDDGKFSQIAIGFYSGATDAYDRLYDAINPNAGSGFSLSSLLDDKKLAIQGLAQDYNSGKIIPLSVENDASQNINFHINRLEGFENMEIYLHDKLHNIMHDLKTTGYNTIVDEGEISGRFELIFARALDVEENTTDKNSITLIQNNRIFNLQSTNEPIFAVQVFDASGKLLYNKQPVNDIQHQINLSHIAGGNLLLFKVTLAGGKSIVKKTISQ